MIMAKSNDLTDLASLLKTDRKYARKERRAQALVEVNQHQAAKVTPEESLRFADYFKPWSEYKAPNATEIALFHEAVKDAAPKTSRLKRTVLGGQPLPTVASRCRMDCCATVWWARGAHPTKNIKGTCWHARERERTYPCKASRYACESSAAMQPVPALVTA